MRKERDSMGEMEVPDNALYGASTQRAVLNFPISGLKFSKRFISCLGLIKLSAGKTNFQLGLLSKERADAIIEASKEVLSGALYDHFVVDIFQTGSGTSTNMNANEVIANRANILLGNNENHTVHPNDHVNMCQSSNDVIPTAMHIATNHAIEEDLIPSLTLLYDSLLKKSEEFKTVIKSGRTHLQDATPVTLGQEFGGYASQVENGVARIRGAQKGILYLALGGTAVGTGLNTHPDFSKKAIQEIVKITGHPYKEAKNHFEAQSSLDAIVELSGQLKTVACSLVKIANDIRWLSAGPRCNIAEIRLPEVQPGSSIMPAKVNPVIAESLLMVCAHVIGNDACITQAGLSGNFELNVMLPVAAYNILQSVELLGSASKNFALRCVDGITADSDRCLKYAEKSLAVCTSLAPKIGYDKAAQIAKRALSENRTVRDVAREMKVLDEKELERALNLLSMTRPGL